MKIQEVLYTSGATILENRETLSSNCFIVEKSTTPITSNPLKCSEDELMKSQEFFYSSGATVGEKRKTLSDRCFVVWKSTAVIKSFLARPFENTERFFRLAVSTYKNPPQR